MGPSPDNQPRALNNRWLRFSLRTAFVLVTIYCVWLAIVTLQARRQQNALARVEALHGHVAFAFELDAEGRDWNSHPHPFLPDWIRHAVGEDYFRRVAIINFDEASDPQDDDLRVLDELPHLRQLTFSNRRKITDDGLAHVAGLKYLKALVLDGKRRRPGPCSPGRAASIGVFDFIQHSPHKCRPGTFESRSELEVFKRQRHEDIRRGLTAPG